MTSALHPITTELILGGQKSGKSRRAELLARDWLAQSADHRAVLIATGQAWDDEMRERIARHQRDRAERVPGLQTVEEPRDVVIGGLGLGYTLEAVLADPRVEQARVVEIEEGLITWMRDGTVPHGRALLADRRVWVVNADLAMAVAEARDRHDLLLLDVDNGPGYLVHESNDSLYEAPFLVQVRDLLRPGGAVAVWSADEAPELERTLGQVFDTVRHDAVPVVLGEREEHYHLYAATVPR